MILANSQPLAERALYWVRQLDAKTDLLANVHVYNVVNYKAKNLADLLTQVYGGAAVGPTDQGDQTRTGGVFGSMGSTMGGTGRHCRRHGRHWAAWASHQSMHGRLRGRDHGRGRRRHRDRGRRRSGGRGGGGTPLKERAAEAGGAAGSSPKEGVRIIPDEENNLLVVVAPPHEWNIIPGILQQLDIMPRQVLERGADRRGAPHR